MVACVPVSSELCGSKWIRPSPWVWSPAYTPVPFRTIVPWLLRGVSGGLGSHEPHTLTPNAACQWSPILSPVVFSLLILAKKMPPIPSRTMAMTPAVQPVAFRVWPPKNIVAAFRAASEQNAVLFFDEADAIATRRSTGAGSAPDRERNLTVNVLLRELETFNGIVIFATNLAANFDRGFERRIRTHVLFEIPGAEERARIWRLQIHPTKTPLGPDVDFKQLAERYIATGGDIKNAVIKAAAAAAAESGPDLGKQIGQHHFESAIREVLAAKTVMRQSLFDEENGSTPDPLSLMTQRHGRWPVAILFAIGLSSTAFIAAIAAIALALLR